MAQDFGEEQMNNLKYVAAGSGLLFLFSLGIIAWCFGPTPMKADPPVVDTAGGKPAALQAGSLHLAPVSAASVAAPATGKALFVDAATGRLSAKDSTGAVVVLEQSAPIPASTPTASPAPTPNRADPSTPTLTTTPPLLRRRTRQAGNSSAGGRPRILSAAGR
jgi:hypothetical protein